MANTPTHTKRKGGRPAKGSVKIQLTVNPRLARQLDQLSEYLAFSNRCDAIRFLMAKGLESFRMGQSIRDQADMFGRFVHEFSEEMDRAVSSAGPSSTGTAAQKCYNSEEDDDDETLPLPFIRGASK